MRAVVDGGEVFAEYRESDVAVNRLLLVEELSYVGGHALDSGVADVERLQKAVDYLEAPRAADGAGHAAARDGPQSQLLRRHRRDDAHPSARVYHEAQRLLRAVDAHADDGAVVDEVERDGHVVGAADGEEVVLRAEVAKEVYEAAYARAPVGVGLRGDAEELLVGVGGLGVALVARGHLAEAVDVVRLVRVDEGGAAKSGEALVESVLVEVNHRESGNRQRLVVLEAEGRAELLDREAEVARAQEGRAEQRVCARGHRVDGDDARRLVEGVLVLALLEERAAQAQTRLRVAPGLREQGAGGAF